MGTDGTLITKDWHAVKGVKSVIKLGTSDVTIDAEGNVSNKGVTIDRLRLVSFNRLDGLALDTD